MKSLFVMLFAFICHTGIAQSMTELYRPIDRALYYSYDSIRETIDLSDNWDFDGDNVRDSFFFVGNGGAHLYFHPKFVLSSNKKIYDLDWIELDLPVLSSINELKEKGNEIYPKIVIHDFDGDRAADVYLNFDIKFSPIPLQWRKRGLSSHQALLKFKNKRLTIMNYVE